jgi:hypothetical protein
LLQLRKPTVCRLYPRQKQIRLRIMNPRQHRQLQSVNKTKLMTTKNDYHRAGRELEALEMEGEPL